MALTVLYDYPVTTPGTTTPAPANQPPPTNLDSSTRFNRVKARLVGDGSTTSVTITHNLGVSTAQLAQDYPEVHFEPLVTGAPSYWVITRAANSITIGLSATTAATFAVVTILRPFSPSK